LINNRILLGTDQLTFEEEDDWGKNLNEFENSSENVGSKKKGELRPKHFTKKK